MVVLIVDVLILIYDVTKRVGNFSERRKLLNQGLLNFGSLISLFEQTLASLRTFTSNTEDSTDHSDRISLQSCVRSGGLRSLHVVRFGRVTAV